MPREGSLPVWMVEAFGAQDLTLLFWFLTTMTLPFWVLFIFFPKKKITRTLGNPYLFPPLLGLIYAGILYLLFTVTGLPGQPGDSSFSEARSWWSQPFLFLALWAHRIIFDLFAGCHIHRETRHYGVWYRFTQTLIWILGPLGLIAALIGRISWRTRKG